MDEQLLCGGKVLTISVLTDNVDLDFLGVGLPITVIDRVLVGQYASITHIQLTRIERIRIHRRLRQHLLLLLEEPRRRGWLFPTWEWPWKSVKWRGDQPLKSALRCTWWSRNWNNGRACWRHGLDNIAHTLLYPFINGVEQPLLDAEFRLLKVFLFHHHLVHVNAPV